MKKFATGVFTLALLTATSLFAGKSAPGAVYTATNSATDNQVLIFDRAANGSLKLAGSVSTGGRGIAPTGLGNQSGIALTGDHLYLLVVNAGSNNISSFAVRPDGLMLVDIVSSRGWRPISVTTHDRTVYVLNAGGQAGSTDNIAGFTIGSDGRLTSIPGSARPLSGANTNPAQIGFNNDGTVLASPKKGRASSTRSR